MTGVQTCALPISAIIGEEELSSLDKQYLRFGERFESDFLSQGEDENRSIGETLDLGWRLLAMLPREELLRVSKSLIDKYLPRIVEASPVTAFGAGVEA